jgi:hypothetical protein
MECVYFGPFVQDIVEKKVVCRKAYFDCFHGLVIYRNRCNLFKSVEGTRIGKAI